MSACVFAIPVRAEDCAVIESRSTLATLSGAHITSVDIVSESPTLPGPAHFLNVLHPVSQEGVIRRQLP